MCKNLAPAFAILSNENDSERIHCFHCNSGSCFNFFSWQRWSVMMNVIPLLQQHLFKTSCENLFKWPFGSFAAVHNSSQQQESPFESFVENLYLIIVYDEESEWLEMLEFFSISSNVQIQKCCLSETVKYVYIFLKNNLSISIFKKVIVAIKTNFFGAQFSLTFKQVKKRCTRLD